MTISNGTSAVPVFVFTLHCHVTDLSLIMHPKSRIKIVRSSRSLSSFHIQRISVSNPDVFLIIRDTTTLRFPETITVPFFFNKKK